MASLKQARLRYLNTKVFKSTKDTKLSKDQYNNPPASLSSKQGSLGMEEILKL